MSTDLNCPSAPQQETAPRPGRIWAIASLVLGILSILGGACFVVPPFLAIVTGFIALRLAARSADPQPSKGLAIAGLIMGLVGLALIGLFFVFQFMS